MSNYKQPLQADVQSTETFEEAFSNLTRTSKMIIVTYVVEVPEDMNVPRVLNAGAFCLKIKNRERAK